MRELEELTKILIRFDSDNEFVLRYFSNPNPKYPWLHSMIQDIIINSIPQHELPSGRDCSNTNEAATKLQLMILNREDKLNAIIYDRFWHHMYKVHDSHFHKKFEEFVNCPFTCLTELKDCILAIANEVKGVN